MPPSSLPHPLPSTADEKNTPLTVSQLNRRARLTIEQEFTEAWVIGELSNFARPRSGHWYFTLKDDQAQVRCAMFANRNRGVQLQPRDGHLVMVRGRVSLYEGRGEFQIIVDHMQAAGEGALRQAFEQLQAKLAAAGLFAAALKRPIPALPQHIVVVTSPTGAALRDILAVWRRRFPVVRVTLVPTLVQGEAAAADLIAALQRAEKLRPDVILLSRGGGSLEDLWPFNMESVAMAIVDCAVPVVTGVGHEIDVTIADYVADLRAPTPSAAAEVLVPDRAELLQVFATLANQLYSLWQQQMHILQLTLRNLRLQLQTPQHVVNQTIQRVDDLHNRLSTTMQRQLHNVEGRLALLQQQLHAHGPSAQLRIAQLKTRQLSQQLPRAMQQALQQHQRTAASLARMLQSVSPLPTLGRGYALVRNADQEVLSDTQQIEPGQTLTTHLQNGRFTSRVLDVEPGAPFSS